MPKPIEDVKLGTAIFERISAMLINEAYDAVFMQVASAKDVDAAMTKGVNYPKGLLAWAQEIGPEKILKRLSDLFELYGEDRYRPNPLLKRMVAEGSQFEGI
jgi:3-hydroxybutyryl-CoA dehydrogenase